MVIILLGKNMETMQCIFLIIGPAVISYIIGYFIGSKTNRKFNCDIIRQKWPHRKIVGYHELGIILGAIQGKPHEYCSAKAKEDDDNG